MLWYVAVIALLNLALGYAWGAKLIPGRYAPQLRMLLYRFPFLDRFGMKRPSGSLGATGPAESWNRPRDPASFAGASPTRPDYRETAVATSPDLAAAAVPAPAVELISRQEADRMIAQFTPASSAEGPLSAALVEVDWSELQTDPGTSKWDERLLDGVASICGSMLCGRDAMARYGERRLLVLLPWENADVATERIEQIRQAIEATEFVLDERPCRLSATCGLAEAGDDPSPPAVIDRLEEALGEATRHGGNRTFLHDGVSPMPVVPTEMNYPARTCAV